MSSSLQREGALSCPLYLCYVIRVCVLLYFVHNMLSVTLRGQYYICYILLLTFNNFYNLMASNGLRWIYA